MSTKVIILLLTLKLHFVFSYNILGVFTVHLYSDFVVLNSIATVLAEHGHNVTVYSKFAGTHGTQNYQHISLSGCFSEKGDNAFHHPELLSSLEGTVGFALYAMHFNLRNKEVKRCEPLKNLIRGNDKYDLMILEANHGGSSDVFAAVAYKWKIPFIGVSSTMLYPWVAQRMVVPDNPSYIPVPYMGYMPQMTFLERVSNTVANRMSKALSKILALTSWVESTHLVGEGIPLAGSVLWNCSLVFTYTHSSINPVRPLGLNVVEIAGVHLHGDVTGLPQDIQQFIEDAEHGVIYFSIGSFMQPSYLSHKALNAFIEVFSRLPQRVIWKWQSDFLCIESEKIFTANWLPQKEILAHPKVKLFISQGGLVSLNEAVFFGVPILGLPIFADQHSNIRYLKKLGVAEELSYKDISEELVYDKITQILNNTSYKEKAKTLSERYKDRPKSPEDTVVYWIEYVIRHNGAAHLRSGAAILWSFQYYLLDVIAFVLIVFGLFGMTIFYTFKLCLFIRKFFGRRI